MRILKDLGIKLLILKGKSDITIIIIKITKTLKGIIQILEKMKMNKMIIQKRIFLKFYKIN
jgi:hypothetical protein